MESRTVLFALCLLVPFVSVYPAAVLESGIRVTPAAQIAIDKIKAGKDLRYGIFYAKDETAIELESTGGRSTTFDEYLKSLKAITPTGKACRYGLDNFDFQCQSSPATKKNKLILMSYCPDDAKVRVKFIHAASVEGMKKAVPGYSVFIQASDDQEASMKAVQDKLQSTQTPC